MNRAFKASCLAIASLGCLVAVACTRGGAESPFAAIDNARLINAASEPHPWLTNGRDFEQSYHSPLTAINRDNVAKLGLAWQYAIDTEDGMETTPIVVDGVMYTSGPKGTVFALDAKTGAELWKFAPQIDPGVSRKVCCGPVNRGVAVWQGLVYVASLDGYLFALDGKTGEVRWKSDAVTERQRGYTITGAPQVAGDVVVIGNAGAELDA